MLEELIPKAGEQAQIPHEAKGIGVILHHANRLPCISKQTNNPDGNRWDFLALYCLLPPGCQLPVMSKQSQITHCGISTNAQVHQLQSGGMSVFGQLLGSQLRPHRG